MTGLAPPLTIRSKHGLPWDLLTVYRPWQRAAVVAGLVVALWLARLIDWKVPPIFLLLAAFHYLGRFEARPSVMLLSPAQAERIEAVMAGEGFFVEGDDGRWHLSGKVGGRSGDVLTLRPSEGGVALSGPRPWLQTIQLYLQWVEAGGVPLSELPQHPFQVAEIEKVPWHGHLPGALILAIIVPLFFYEAAMGRIGEWGLSGKAIAEGRYETIALHMIEHGGLTHLIMNGAALVALAGPLTLRLGRAPLNWLRLFLLFVMSGLVGAGLYLALHPFGQVPMVGASGAIYGLAGLLIRLPPRDEALRSLHATRIRAAGWAMIKENLFLIALLGLMAWSSGSSGGLAWEAHLGGFLFGFYVGPRLLPSAAVNAPASNIASGTADRCNPAP